ncbi:hypothetical protein ABID22_001542 [Pontibacter aydingkolensis]|uniref:DUF5672 domain-containing protein n=1 Tax=Pontibacter aydingkolensis TaxID=1911536 RepID=A0ABS7CTN5_9BACT|nr:DUF5672 family protein [Pontibacter aydingkolensis]MBW7467216.1 hypothetical protein [Pontibacter aydingkolensis]
MREVSPIVIIPVYKELNMWLGTELLSMIQCCEILSNHPICLIGPHNLDWPSIKKFIHQSANKTVNVASFDNQYFADIPGYNKLLKSLFFYEHFKSYSHLLIYQLDAYVFKDELEYWCRKDYDYIGAPWLEGLTDNSSTTLIGVGNGGFSLHKISSAIKVLKKLKLILPILESCENTVLYNRLPFLKWVTRLLLLKMLFRINNQKYILKLSKSDETYEDIFWGRYIPATFQEFNIAGVGDAIKFSFEVNPKYLYQLNNEELPFGCHAWEKYDPEFWKKFIDSAQLKYEG